MNTILIDSKQLESGEALSNTFKKAARTQIEQFRRKMNVEKVTDGDLLREVMNTVGKKGELGEQIKCVVSVSMLSEGWDAKRVTHILGVRAFSTQLLCEQVVGRGLRRSSHDVEQTTVDVNGATGCVGDVSTRICRSLRCAVLIHPSNGQRQDNTSGICNRSGSSP